MKTFDDLTAARDASLALVSRARSLLSERDALKTEAAEADADLTRQLGLERLGEGDAGALKAARKRAETAAEALRAADAAGALLDEKMAAAETALRQAEEAFRWDARDRIQTEYERCRDKLYEQALALALTLRQFAQLDAVAHALERGMRTGTDLLRAAGDPFESIRREEGIELSASFASVPKRLSSDEIATIVDFVEQRENRAAEAAE